jgi:hypothetical protein
MEPKPNSFMNNNVRQINNEALKIFDNDDEMKIDKNKYDIELK